MKIDPKKTTPAVEQDAALKPQMVVRTGLRAGEGCDAGLSYWRSEYNKWKKLAKSMGCA
jgi:hypothetical protein